MKDYYRLLDIKNDASQQTIKNAYRKLALKYHPDRNPNNKVFEDYFKLINEAYETLSNVNLKEDYDYKYYVFSQEQKTQEKQVLPQTFLDIIQKINKEVSKVTEDRVNKLNLFNNIIELFSNNNINYILQFNNKTVNKELLEEIIKCSLIFGKDKHPDTLVEYKDTITEIIYKLANNDLFLLDKIMKYKRSLIKKKIIKSLTPFVIVAVILISIPAVLLNTPKNNNYTSLENGDIHPQARSKDTRHKHLSQHNDNKKLSKYSEYTEDYKEKFDDSKLNNFPKSTLEKQKADMKSEGWSEVKLENGQLPLINNYNPLVSKINNYLEVSVGEGTDVALKLMNAKTDECVRFVYVNSGTSYKIKNIPEGKYYVKIAYGKNWYSKIEKEQYHGKFLVNPLYKKGNDILNFNIHHTLNGYEIPSFQLDLDITYSSSYNSYDSNNISELEFNM